MYWDLKLVFKLINKTFILFLLVFSCIGSSIFAFENAESSNSVISDEQIKDFQNKVIRVLLSNKSSFEQKEVIISADDELFVTSENQLVLSSNYPIKVIIQGDYYVLQTQEIIKKVLISEKLIFSTEAKSISLDNFMKAGKKANYSGNIELTASSGKIKVINIVDIEDYLKGVVPNEMPVYFGLEALKAQAIAARGYAYRDSVYKNADYDVCDTTGSQVYYGYNTNDPISNKAIDETFGQFALYDGKIILSLYSSTAGGHTENYENAFSKNGIDTKFPADPIPYLKGVPDIETNLDLTRGRDAKEFYSTKPDSFEQNSPKYRWEYFWTVEDFENIVAKNIIKFSSTKFVTPSIKKKEDFGNIQNIDIPKRGVSGKAMYVRITTDKGVFLIAKEIMIRKIFEFENKWLPSANIVIEKVANANNEIIGYKAIGGGFGHGVGMSQFGAMGMAKRGFSYDKILKHYYTGISIGSYPVECKLKELKNCKSTFYFNNGSGNLILQYNQKPHDINFKINGAEILASSKDFDKKSGQINIKKFLKRGINTIELSGYDSTMLDFSNNTVKFYVELEGSDE